jgi:hypothetical protein
VSLMVGRDVGRGAEKKRRRLRNETADGRTKDGRPKVTVAVRNFPCQTLKISKVSLVVITISLGSGRPQGVMGVFSYTS